MIRKHAWVTFCAATLAIGGFAQAQISASGGKPIIAKTQSQRISLPHVNNPLDAVTPIGLTGHISFDGFGTPGNDLVSTDLGALVGTPGGPVRVTGIGWDTTVETVGFSFASEAGIDFNNQVALHVGAGDNIPTPPGGIAYTSGGIVDLIGLNLDFVTGNGILDLEFYEDFDDNPGDVDARYLNGALNIQFEAALPVQPPVAMNLGVIGNLLTNIFVDSRGSNFDTELGVYNSAGILLATNDDIDLGGGDLDSEILLGTLPAGTYYTALGGFNTTYGFGFGVTGGTSAGNFVFNYNTGSMAGAITANQVKWFSFQVVPEPSSVALVVCGLGLLLARRRK